VAVPGHFVRERLGDFSCRVETPFAQDGENRWVELIGGFGPR
jgi:hypothetical protein